MQAAPEAIEFMSKRIGRWRGHAVEYAVLHKVTRDDWHRAGDFHDVQGSRPRAPAHQQDEYTVAADIRRNAQRHPTQVGLTEESIHVFTAAPAEPCCGGRFGTLYYGVLDRPPQAM